MSVPGMMEVTFLVESINYARIPPLFSNLNQAISFKR